MEDITGTVRSNITVARETFVLSVDCDLPASTPGQFVMMKIAYGYEPFLRRPFAILSNRGQSLEILYKIKGRGTRMLSEKKPGDAVSLLGPLGRGFSAPDEKSQVVYVAGGTGLPPVLSLAEYIRQGILIFGAQSKNHIPLLERMSTLPGVELKIATEDGSYGHMGLATDLLEESVGTSGGPVSIYACGPKGMLSVTNECAERTGARCQVSLEEFMSCGFGVCSGCVVETIHGNKRVCREGPVFDARELLF